MTFSGYHFWGITKKTEPDRLFCCLPSRKRCVEWLAHKKEECFFETGSMETAEENWGVENFKFEEVFVVSQNSFIKNFGRINPDKWNYDI